MAKQKLVIVYYKSGADMDEKVLELFKKQAEVIVTSDLTATKDAVEDHEKQAAMLVADLRGEPEYGDEKLDGIQAQPLLAELPLVTICGHLAYKEYTVSINHGAEIINLPADMGVVIRRCNRACGM